MRYVSIRPQSSINENTMQISETAIAGVFLIIPRRHVDDRGTFVETYSRAKLAEHGIITDFKQDNLSRSIFARTIRGLHYQLPPFAQAKLVAVPHGRIFDVAVDLRRSSRTFGKHVSAELSAERGQLFIPAGFAHGFCTLEEDTIVTYKVDEYYSPAHERGLHWESPELGIDWPLASQLPRISAKDGELPRQLAESECFA